MLPKRYIEPNPMEKQNYMQSNNEFLYSCT